MTEEVGSQDKPFRLEEATIDELQQAIIGALADMDAKDCVDEIAAAIFREEAGVETREAGLYALVALKAEGEEQKGSQSFIPPDAKDDRALQSALALIRGTETNPAFPPNPKQAGGR